MKAQQGTAKIMAELLRQEPNTQQLMASWVSPDTYATDFGIWL
jgi:hypothetical protein